MNSNAPDVTAAGDLQLGPLDSVAGLDKVMGSTTQLGAEQVPFSSRSIKLFIST